MSAIPIPAGAWLGRLSMIALSLAAFGATVAHAQSLSPSEARAIAKEATIYGFPLVDSYRIQYSYFVDRSSPEFKAPWNTLSNNARVYTPDDKAIQTPNSDTPLLILSARICAPNRWCSPCRRSRRGATTRFNSSTCTRSISPMSAAAPPATTRQIPAGRPGWKGKTPPGIKAVIRSETEFAFVLYRTQLFDAGRHRQRQENPGRLQG